MNDVDIFVYNWFITAGNVTKKQKYPEKEPKNLYFKGTKRKKIILEDYIEKIKQLPDDRLHSLVDGYRKTLAQLKDQYKLAVQAAILTVADYTKVEIDKKQAELDAIEKILADRH